MQANKWHCKPWELSLTERIHRHDKLLWHYRWMLWQEQRAIWRNQLDYENPATLDLIQVEFMRNG